MPEEKISLKKAIDISPLAWVKSFFIGIRFLLLLGGLAFIGFTIYRAYFVKTQEQKIIVQKGATAVIQQRQESKRRTFIPFMEASVEQRSQATFQTGIRIGVRLEW